MRVAIIIIIFLQSYLSLPVDHDKSDINTFEKSDDLNIDASDSGAGPSVPDHAHYHFKSKSGKVYRVLKEKIDALDRSQIKRLVDPGNHLNTKTNDGYYDVGSDSEGHERFFNYLQDGDIDFSKQSLEEKNDMTRLFDYHGVPMPYAYQLHKAAMDHYDGYQVKLAREQQKFDECATKMLDDV
jgi:hypothetical protein